MKKIIIGFMSLILPLSVVMHSGASMVYADNIVNSENTVEELFSEKDDTDQLPEVLDEDLNEESLTDFIVEYLNNENNPDVEFTDTGVYIDGIYYTPEEFEELLDEMVEPTELEVKLTDDQPSVGTFSVGTAFFIPAIGQATVWLYPVPGVGQVAVVAVASVGAVYGTYILSKNIVKAGHWAYTSIRNYVNSKPRPKTKSTTSYNYQKSVPYVDYIVYKYGIPKRLLDAKGNVRVRDFNQKVTGRNRPTWKEPKTGWIKEKDDTNHAGKKWKIKDKQGNRKASVDGNGKIISK